MLSMNDILGYFEKQDDSIDETGRPGRIEVAVDIFFLLDKGGVKPGFGEC